MRREALYFQFDNQIEQNLQSWYDRQGVVSQFIWWNSYETGKWFLSYFLTTSEAWGVFSWWSQKVRRGSWVWHRSRFLPAQICRIADYSTIIRTSSVKKVCRRRIRLQKIMKTKYTAREPHAPAIWRKDVFRGVYLVSHAGLEDLNHSYPCKQCRYTQKHSQWLSHSLTHFEMQIFYSGQTNNYRKKNLKIMFALFNHRIPLLLSHSQCL